MAYKRVNKVFVSSDEASTYAWAIADANPANLIEEGEVIVLGADKQPILIADADIEDNPTIYIAKGLANVWVDENGDSHRELEISDPIDGSDVVAYYARDFEAAVEKQVTVDFGTLVPEIGEEYALKIVYKDLYEHPAHFTYTYRVIARTAVAADLSSDFADRIMADARRRVDANDNAGDLEITGRVVPSNAQLNSIDEYRQVDFEVFLYSDNFGDATVGTDNPATSGSGTAALVRDAEKHALSHKGITNRTSFPVIKPELSVDMAEEYDLITIVHNKEYMSANNQYLEKTQLQTQIYIPDGCDQRAALLDVLNPWMATTPRALANIA